MKWKFPDDFKLGRVPPIYKKSGSIDDCGNYRPISVINHLSKVLEKLVQSHLINYINENLFITPSQSAFLCLHSTHTALHKVITGFCFYNMKKYFDSINHKILLFKLNKLVYVLWIINGLHPTWPTGGKQLCTKVFNLNSVMYLQAYHKVLS